ncbi:hypothetical protein [Plantactinospora soyae]|uniref:Uncharacterized protein n=1 Tax=Plantactinospora soyae TaxID=1544732 RepID=A0A927M8L5_9ACTN|nr:hypothetical protein [Plantactinospora soyae]MBE1489997.1 hypothetical protein [Plantactinospora soyae]
MTESVRVEPDALRVAGQVPCELATELCGVRDRWDGVTADPGDALGVAEVTTAFTRLQERWHGELSVHVRLLAELCDGVVLSADGYATSDATAATRLGGDGPVKAG